MSVYDGHIEQVRGFLKGRQSREFICPASVDDLREGLPVRVGPGANPGIILRSEMYMELGSPAEGSTGFIIWTENPDLVRDGRVILVGPDITEVDGGSRPFAQVVMLAGKKLGTELQEKIEEYQHISDNLEGYMVRSSSRNIWGRISREAAALGFNMETLARALMITMKSGIPEIESMEVLFVTSAREDVRDLDAIAREVEATRKEVIREYWKEKGYDLECELDCSSCNSRETCDDIKEIILARHRREESEMTGGGG